MRNKKAMSEIVTTVIMVVLALVAVAVIWQIINNLISDKGAQISVTQKCLDVKLNVESASCDAVECTIAVKRAAGGDDIAGLKVVLKNTDSVTGESSSVIDSSELTVPVTNIEELGTATVVISAAESGMTAIALTNKIEMTAYIEDESGQNQNCPSTATYNVN